MGLFIGTAKLLLDEVKQRPFYGSLLQLGLQDINFSKKQFFSIAQKKGFAINHETINPKTTSAKENYNYINNTEFFKYMGFSEINSMDYSDYEGSNVLFDLNNSDLPDNMHERFDFILDAGTLEHVFHTPNALNNITSMCKVGGRIMHISPSSNQANHGFYSFSPTLFYNFYNLNNFIFHRFLLCRLSLSAKALYTLDLMSSSQFATDIIRLDSGIYYTICIVEKKESVSYIQIPQQSSFVKAWNQWGQGMNISNEGMIRSRVIPILHKLGLFDLAKHLFIVFERIRLQLKFTKIILILCSEDILLFLRI